MRFTKWNFLKTMTLIALITSFITLVLLFATGCGTVNIAKAEGGKLQKPVTIILRYLYDPDTIEVIASHHSTVICTSTFYPDFSYQNRDTIQVPYDYINLSWSYRDTNIVFEILPVTWAVYTLCGTVLIVGKL